MAEIKLELTSPRYNGEIIHMIIAETIKEFGNALTEEQIDTIKQKVKQHYYFSLLNPEE
jgi:hypothetical protein